MEVHQPKLYPKGASGTSIEEHPVRNVSKIIKSVTATMLIGLFALGAIACGQESEPIQAPEPAELATSDVSPTPPKVAEAVLDLPVAPDFTLPAVNRGSTEISLSSFQGDKEVVLVFYRAYW